MAGAMTFGQVGNCLRSCLEIPAVSARVTVFLLWLDAQYESKKRKQRYPSHLSEGAWRGLKPLLPVPAVGRGPDR